MPTLGREPYCCRGTRDGVRRQAEPAACCGSVPSPWPESLARWGKKEEEEEEGGVVGGKGNMSRSVHRTGRQDTTRQDKRPYVCFRPGEMHLCIAGQRALSLENPMRQCHTSGVEGGGRVEGGGGGPARTRRDVAFRDERLLQAGGTSSTPPVGYMCVGCVQLCKRAAVQAVEGRPGIPVQTLLSDRRDAMYGLHSMHMGTRLYFDTSKLQGTNLSLCLCRRGWPARSRLWCPPICSSVCTGGRR